ncbi:hypothetical protein H5410_024368 [Solanum commersonii]|uniref:Uncharacterized protein n=1 Tax=Solanum commersonii TaxID=4109 RepID=A0A9J5ZLT4_SOLCO|nr:hypothetical protein H5410_024368 [Solanum commersonii]
MVSSLVISPESETLSAVEEDSGDEVGDGEELKYSQCFLTKRATEIKNTIPHITPEISNGPENNSCPNPETCSSADEEEQFVEISICSSS